MSLIVVPPPIRLYRADRQLSPARSGEYPAEPGEGGPQGRGSTRRSRGRGARKVGGVPGGAGGGGPARSGEGGGSRCRRLVGSSSTQVGGVRCKSCGALIAAGLP